MTNLSQPFRHGQSTSSPLPCGVNPLHGRSTAVMTFGRETIRLCPSCKKRCETDLLEFSLDWLEQQAQRSQPQATPDPERWKLMVALICLAVTIGTGLIVLIRWWVG